MSDETTMPDWVLIEAAKRSCFKTRDPSALRASYNHPRAYEGYQALCDMILKYEEPPIDPIEEAAQAIADDFRLNLSAMPKVELALQKAIRRGIELAESKP